MTWKYEVCNDISFRGELKVQSIAMALTEDKSYISRCCYTVT
jgi:hypothetical protein